MKKYGEFGNEYIAYAYYGLSRVCHNNQQVQKKYRKIADNLTDYRNVNFDWILYDDHYSTPPDGFLVF